MQTCLQTRARGHRLSSTNVQTNPGGSGYNIEPGSAGLGWGLGFCISNLPGDPKAAGSRATLLSSSRQRAMPVFLRVWFPGHPLSNEQGRVENKPHRT